MLAAVTSLLALGLPAGVVAEEGQQRSEWLIGFNGPPGRGQLERIERSGGEVIRGLRGLPVVLAELPERSVEQIEDGEGVRYVEPNGQVRALGDELPWGVERIDAPGAWTAGKETDAWADAREAGADVTVAVLDSGIIHDDAFDHLTTACTDIAEGDDCEDVYGHGTHVAGTIAASHDSRTPGIAPGVDLHNVKVLDDGGVGTHADIAEGIVVASDPDREGDVGPADVINMSLGGGSNSAVEDAVTQAAEQGVLLVAAAGNSGNPGGNNDSVSYPANYDEVIAVAATDEDDERATFSSTGPGVEIAAPGVDIPSTWPEEGDHDFDDCGDDCDYHNGSGTSMASPHVAGAAALALAADPDRSAEEVRTDLAATAEELDASENEVGAGLVDAAALLERTLADEDDGDEPDEPGAIAGKVTDEDTGNAIGGATVTVEVDGGQEESTTTADDGSYELDELPEGEHTVTADATDYEPATTEAEVEAGETTEDVDFTLAPEPDDEEEPEGAVSISETDYDTRGGRDNDRHLDITVLLVDEDGEPVTDTHIEIEIDRDDGTETWTFSDDTDDQGSMRFTINNHDPGCYTTTVTDVGTDDWDGKTPEDNTHGCEE